MIESLTIATLTLFFAAILASLALRGRPSLVLSYSILCTASALMAFQSLMILLGGASGPHTFTLYSYSMHGLKMDFKFHFDWLTALFTLLLGIVSFTASLYSIKYLEHYGSSARWVAPCFGIFVLSMYLLLASWNIVWFYILWEIMTVSSMALIVFEYGRRDVRFSTVLYAVTMHVGSLLLLLGILAGVAATGSTDCTTFLHALSELGQLKYVVAVLMSLGFLFKAGLVPFHVWLPDAHASAPSNVSALLSGMMVKMGVYGLVRFVIVPLDGVCLSYGLTLVVLGLASALVGALNAVLQEDYKRIMAFSTIENMGIIAIGLGLASIAVVEGLRELYALSLAASLFHVVNHAMFKPLVFLCGGTVLRATGTRDLNQLGGLRKLLPGIYVNSVVGSIAASSLPPLNGFASKLLIYEALLLTAFATGLWIVRLICLLAAVALASSGILVAMAFAKFVSSAFTGGEPRTKALDREHPVEVAATSMLSTACIALALLAPWVYCGMASLVGGAPVELHTLIAMSVGVGYWSYPPLVSYLVLSALLFGLFLASLGLYRRPGVEVRRLAPFVSAADYNPEAQRPTASTFTEVVREYLAGMAGIKSSIEREYAVSYWTTKRLRYVVEQRRHLVDARLKLRDPGEFFERTLYAPVARFVIRLGDAARALQCGSLLVYIAYVFVAYLVLMGVLAWIFSS